MSGKRILVLGSTGRVGRLLRLAWDQNPPEGVELILQSRDVSGVKWQSGQPNPFGRVDAVIALWGVTHGDPDALAMNATLALAAQDIATECKATRVLHCSSIAVYAPSPAALREDDPTQPTNPYGQAKLRMEHSLQTAAGPSPTCLRIGSVVGAESLAASIRQGWEGGAPVVTLDQFEDGKGPARSYIAPSDLARIMIALALHDGVLPFALNVGAPKPVFMEDFLAAAGHPMAWRNAPDGARQYAVLSCDRLKSLVDLPAGMSDPAHLVQDWLRLEGRA